MNFTFYLKEICSKKAGIKKRTNLRVSDTVGPHILLTFQLRHRTTHHFDWIEEFDMPSMYVHMSGCDVDSTLYSFTGL